MARAVTGVGLIRNPNSQRNRGVRLGTLPASLQVAEPQTLPELAGALADFAAREVRLLIVSGGDGTLREVCSLLPEAYGAQPWPRLCVLTAGNANLIAADVGGMPSRRGALAAILRAEREACFTRQTRRCPLELRWPCGSHPPVRGFFMGAAALARATRFAHDCVLHRGIRFNTSVLLTLAGSILQTLRGRSEWLAGEPLGVAIDGAAPAASPRFLFLATTLHRLMLGVWPFWGGDGPIRWLDVAAPPRALGRALLPLLRGRPRPWMAAGGYRSGSAQRLLLATSSPLIVDGEAFAAGAQGIIEVRPGRALTFVSP